MFPDASALPLLPLDRLVTVLIAFVELPKCPVPVADEFVLSPPVSLMTDVIKEAGSMMDLTKDSAL